MAISKKTIKKLWSTSGNQCAFPECERSVFDLDLGIVVGEMGHIRAKNPEGPRYDPDMDKDEKDSYSNLIVLCPTHHTIVDKLPDKFPPEDLKQWKQEHEQRSPDAPELPPDLIEKLLVEFTPSNLLVHVDRDDLECLSDVLDWKPREEFPEMKEHELFPIEITFDDLKTLHSRLAAPYQTRMDCEPMYKETSEWTEDELIHATAVVAQITQSAIQHYQVESNRWKSEFLNNS